MFGAGGGFFKAIKIGILGENLLGPAAKQAGSLLDGLKAKAEAVGRAGKYMLLGAGAIGGALMFGAHEFGKAEEAMLKAKTAMTGTPEAVNAEYAGAMKAAHEFTSMHTASMMEWGTAAFRMETIGLKNRAMIDATNASLKFAAANFTDGAAASNLLAMGFTVFGDRSKAVAPQLENLSDKLTATMRAFNVRDLGGLAIGLRKAGMAAANAKVDIADTLAIVGQLSSVMMPRAIGNAMKDIISKLDKAATLLHVPVVKTATGSKAIIATLSEMAKKMPPLGSTMREAWDKMFGKEAGAIGMIMSNMDRVKAGLAKIQDSAGMTEKSASTMEHSWSGTMTTMKNADQ